MKEIDTFTYLGRYIRKEETIGEEISPMIDLASAVFVTPHSPNIFKVWREKL